MKCHTLSERHLFLYETCVKLQQASLFIEDWFYFHLFVFASQLQSHRHVKQVYTIIAYGYFFLPGIKISPKCSSHFHTLSLLACSQLRRQCVVVIKTNKSNYQTRLSFHSAHISSLQIFLFSLFFKISWEQVFQLAWAGPTPGEIQLWLALRFQVKLTGSPAMLIELKERSQCWDFNLKVLLYSAGVWFCVLDEASRKYPFGAAVSPLLSWWRFDHRLVCGQHHCS